MENSKMSTSWWWEGQHDSSSGDNGRLFPGNPVIVKMLHADTSIKNLSEAAFMGVSLWRNVGCDFSHVVTIGQEAIGVCLTSLSV